MKKDFIISIDMGGTKILAAAINSEEGIIHSVKRSTKITKKDTDFAEVLYDLVEYLLEETGLPEKKLKAICLGVPGSVNPETGIIGLAPNLNIKNYNIKQALQEYTKVPVLIENDVNLAALGIHNFGVAKGKENALVVFIGTGIGSGLIFNGGIYRGNSFAAGEIGHMHVLDNGPICGCGKHGCFEAVASRTAIVRNITKEIKTGTRSKLAKLVNNNSQIKSKALSNALKANDKLAWKHIRQASETIGKTLASINNLLNLELIVLGGGVIEAMHQYVVPIIKESFKEYSLKDSARTTKILNSKLLDDAALFGGMALAKEFLNIEV